MKARQLIEILSKLPDEEVYISYGSDKRPIIVCREAKEHFILQSGEEPSEYRFILISSNEKHQTEFR